jgi:hypothetical protein
MPDASRLTFEAVDQDEFDSIALEVTRFAPEVQQWQTGSLKIMKRALLCYRDYQLLLVTNLDRPDQVLLGTC